jgi:RecA-family ATPase
MTTIQKFPSDFFDVESTKDIIERAFVAEEYIVKGLVPRHGFGVVYGASQSLKSFIAVDLGYHIALGWGWAGRRVSSAPVFYVCAEGAGGIRKRIRGFINSHPDYTADPAFFVMKAAPDLGSNNSDFDRLVSTIKATWGRPGLLIIDTLQQCLGGADENGAGMINFIRNAQNLSRCSIASCSRFIT